MRYKNLFVSCWFISCERKREPNNDCNELINDSQKDVREEKVNQGNRERFVWGFQKWNEEEVGFVSESRREKDRKMAIKMDGN